MRIPAMCICPPSRAQSDGHVEYCPAKVNSSMDNKDILTACILDSTNNLLAKHHISPIEIDPPLLTDKVSQEAIQAYTSNAGPDANAWKELEKMAAKAAVFDLMMDALSRISILDPDVDSSQGYNEWGEAECLGHAKIIAANAIKKVLEVVQ